MATIVYDNVTYTVKYVDPITAPDGDGSTVATAMSTLPATLTDYTCYLIRRTTDEDNLGVDLQRTRNSGKTHIMFLGMPYPDSDLYSQIEQDAKTAWGNDSGTYARIRCNCPTANTTNVADGTIFYENNIQMLYCENCYFFRDANGANASRYLMAIFYFGSDNTSTRNLIWKKCKFSYAQYDLESDDFLASNSNITLNNYSERKCGAYVDCHSAYSFILKDCIINNVECTYTYDSAGSAQHANIRGINIWNYCYNFEMDNCIINKLPYATTTSYWNYHATVCVEANRQPYGTRALVKNCTFNYILFTGNTNYYYPHMFYCQSASQTYLNNTVKLKRMSGYTTASYSCNFDPNYQTGIITCNTPRYNLIVDGLYCNMANDNYIKVSGCNVMRCQDIMPTGQGNPSSRVRNIDIRFPASPNRTNTYDIFTIYSTDYMYQDSSWGRPYYDISCQDWYNRDNQFLVEDIYVDAQGHPGTAAVYIGRCGLKTDTLKCKLTLYSATAQVNYLYNKLSNSTAITLQNNSYLKLERLEANMSNYNGIRQVDNNARASCYITTSNVMPYNENCISTTNQYGANANLVCLNTIESGQFFTRNPMVFAKSWSTIRTGSNALASLKLYANVYNHPIYPLCVGANPYKGIEITPATLGKKILTCYCARGLFSNSEIQRANTKFWIEVYTPEIQADETVDYICEDSFSKDFIADTSTWSGTTAVTPFKIEVPIEVKELTVPIEVKIYYNWYGASGFVYVDPDIRLIDVAE